MALSHILQIVCSIFSSLSSVFKICLCSFSGSMFYICEQCIFVLIIYATNFLTECMFLYIGFMMPPTNHPVSLSVGIFPQIVMLTFKIFFYSFAESMPCFHLGSALNVNLSCIYLALVLMSFNLSLRDILDLGHLMQCWDWKRSVIMYCTTSKVTGSKVDSSRISREMLM